MSFSKQLDGASVENQHLPSLKPSDAKFEESYRMTVPAINRMRHVLQSDIVDDLMANQESHQLLDEEWSQLKFDRDLLRQTFPDGMP